MEGEHSVGHSSPMVLHAGYEETILFGFATVTTLGGFIGTCIILFSVSICLEILRLLGWWLETKYFNNCKTAGKELLNSNNCKCTLSTIQTSNSGPLDLNDQNNYNHPGVHRPTCTASKDNWVPEVAASKKFTDSQWNLQRGYIGILQFLTYMIGTLLMLVAMTMNIYLIISIGIGSVIGKILSVHARSRLLIAIG